MPQYQSLDFALKTHWDGIIWNFTVILMLCNNSRTCCKLWLSDYRQLEQFESSSYIRSVENFLIFKRFWRVRFSLLNEKQSSKLQLCLDRENWQRKYNMVMILSKFLFWENNIPTVLNCGIILSQWYHKIFFVGMVFT